MNKKAQKSRATKLDNKVPNKQYWERTEESIKTVKINSESGDNTQVLYERE